jgi:hypothetical protein
MVSQTSLLFPPPLEGLICPRRLYDLFEAIQRHEGPAARAAVFFGAFAFFLSQISVNVVACGTVGGMDLAALLPKYLNIRRGSFLVALIGFAINPWKILNVRASYSYVVERYLSPYHDTDSKLVHLGHLRIRRILSSSHRNHGVSLPGRVEGTSFADTEPVLSITSYVTARSSYLTCIFRRKRATIGSGMA